MSTTVTAVLLALSLANVCFSLPVTTTTENSTDAGGQPQPQDTDDGGVSGETIGGAVGAVGGAVACLAALCAGYRFRSKIFHCHCCHQKPHYENGDSADHSNDSSTAEVVVPWKTASAFSYMSSYVREALTGAREAGFNRASIHFTMDAYM